MFSLLQKRGTKEKMTEEVKTLLIVTASFNEETGKPEYDWQFPDNCATSRMLGILELIKFDLLTHWDEQNSEDIEG